MVLETQLILKLLLAILVGGAIGVERELHHKAAGVRTMILICVGATLFTLMDTEYNAGGRIAANIATGVGFIGAGVILHESNRIRGLTTAATVWLSAALGMGIGFGAYLLTVVAAALVLVVLRLFAPLEVRLDELWEMRTYQIDFPCRLEKIDQMNAALQKCGLKPATIMQMKRDGLLSVTCAVSGATSKQQEFVQLMLNDPEVSRIEW
jgi:putative Mg2+ transporter-C (MgtC) family protein